MIYFFADDHYVYFHNNKDYYVTYSEKSDIDYKVFLKENKINKLSYFTNNQLSYPPNMFFTLYPNLVK